ncbi:MAG: phospho-sugar mutase [Clostridia bacterium]|nr:phospho-sugar mutase [Clostridia bacterium]
MSWQEMYTLWRNSKEINDDCRAWLDSMSETEREDAFYKSLEFGTAGMRGVIAPGTNRMNKFTVRRATKGLADYINTLGAEAAKRGVIISYDTRKMSSEFACHAARVLSANGIKVFLFENVRPVPLCSYAIMHLNCIAGIMITASHNPKVYNGYKVYGDDGAQMSPEATEKVVEFISKTPYFGIAESDIQLDASIINGKDNFKVDENITVIGKSLDSDYFDTIEKLSLSPEAVKEVGKTLKIVYTPIHGSGYMPVTTILKRMGIPFNVVEEQAKPDTEFSTVKVPNPEEPDALALGVKLADEIKSDIVIGTDPDCDRMGIAVRDNEGKFVLLNGNQIGVLLANYIMLRKKEEGTLPKNGAVVKTIVTTEMARKVADAYGATTFDVLTGFKFIGEKIAEWEKSGEYTYLFGFEESYGSLVGTHARDKDAVVAAMMFAEMACYYASKKTNVYDELQKLFKTYGYFVEKTASVAFGGIDGMATMKRIMIEARERKYTDVAGVKVLSASDLVIGKETFANGVVKDIDLPKTSALKLKLEGGDWVCIRPSGTEPKLKVYVAASEKTYDLAFEKAQKYLAFMKEMLQ